MRIALAAALVLAVPTLVHATPNTLGLGAGVTPADAAGGDAGGTFYVLARIGLAHRLGLQGELARISTDSTDGDDASARTFTLAATYDLVDTGRWVPLLLAGAGLDWASGSETGTHVEAGVGLEVRFDRGLTIGADVRLGDRSMSAPAPTPVLTANDGVPFTGTGAGPELPEDAGSSALADGGYKSARLYAAIHW